MSDFENQARRAQLAVTAVLGVGLLCAVGGWVANYVAKNANAAPPSTTSSVRRDGGRLPTNPRLVVPHGSTQPFFDKDAHREELKERMDKFFDKARAHGNVRTE